MLHWMPLQPVALPVPGQPCGCVAPHTPGVFPPGSGGQLMPQSSEPPQPSPIVPQYCPPPFGAVQLPFVQLVGTHTLFGLQVCPAGQSPQGSVPPQPSPTVSQKCVVPTVHAMGVHTLVSP